MLDPLLHTVEYLRVTSPFLFTAIMLVACTFFEPRYSGDLRKMANAYAGRYDWRDLWARMRSRIDVLVVLGRCLVENKALSLYKLTAA